MGKLRTALSVAADLASIATMTFFLIGLIVVMGAMRSGRFVARQPESKVTGQPVGRNLSEAVSGRIPLRSGAEHYPPQARIAVIEFGNFECTYCARFDRYTLPQLKAELVDSGTVAFIYRDFPVERHGLALEASKAASCAQAQGQYWPMHTQLFARQGRFLKPQLIDLARELNLEADAFARCLSGESTSAKVDQSIGRMLGVSVTPTFFIGRIVSGEEVELKWRLLGAQPVSAFKDIVERISREPGTN